MELHRVRANGSDFGYFEEGSGPLALLIHGFPDTAHSWDQVRPAVAAAGYRAVTPFLRGYYPSSLAPDGKYDIQTLAEDVVALIDALGEKDAILIGHDWGAAASYGAAAIAPEKTRKLITLAIPHPAGVPPTPGVLWGARHFFTLKLPGAAKRFRRDGFALVDHLVHRWSPAWTFGPEETKHAKECYAHPGSGEAAVSYYKQLSPLLPPCHKKKITVPTVVFAGTQDGALKDLSLYDKAGSRFTGEYEVVRMPGGHFLHREHPERFIEELLPRLA